MYLSFLVSIHTHYHTHTHTTTYTLHLRSTRRILYPAFDLSSSLSPTCFLYDALLPDSSTDICIRIRISSIPFKHPSLSPAWLRPSVCVLHLGQVPQLYHTFISIATHRRGLALTFSPPKNPLTRTRFTHLPVRHLCIRPTTPLCLPALPSCFAELVTSGAPLDFLLPIVPVPYVCVFHYLAHSIFFIS